MPSLQRYITPCCLQEIPREPNHYEEPTIQYNDNTTQYNDNTIHEDEPTTQYNEPTIHEPTIQYNDDSEDTPHDGDWFVRDDPIYLQGQELAAVLNEEPEPVRNVKRNQ